MKLGLFTHSHPTAPAAGKYYAEDGTKRTVGVLTRSNYTTATFESLAELAAWIADEARPDQHLTQGTAEHAQAVCVSQADRQKFNGIDPETSWPFICRTNDDLPLANNAGLMVIDSDSAGETIDFDQVWGALCAACPELVMHNCVQTTSSGSNIIRGEHSTGVGGIHTFYHVKDASDIPRALEALHVRMCLKGYARHKLSATGAFLARSFVDRALRVPSQPIYLKAHCLGTVTQDKQTHLRQSIQEVLDTAAVIKPLTDDELEQFAQHLKQAEAALKPEMEQQQAMYLEGRAEKMMAERPEMTKEAAIGAIKHALGEQVLAADFQIRTKQGTVTVQDILSDPANWHEVNCRDPLEPDYGSDTIAKIYSHQNRPVIRSYAHTGGDDGKVYHLSALPSKLGALPEGATPVPEGVTAQAAPMPPVGAPVLAIDGFSEETTQAEITEQLKIVAMIPSAIDRERAIKSISKSTKVNKSTLDDELRTLRREDAEVQEQRAQQRAAQKAAAVNSFTPLQTYIYNLETDTFFDRKRKTSMSRVSFDLIYASQTPPVFETPSGMALENGRNVSATEYFNSYLHGPVVDGAMYDPRESADVFFDAETQKTFVNSYRPDSVPALQPHEGSEAVALIANHINTICGTEAELMFDFMAFVVQHAGQRIRWAPILLGKAGNGKTTVFKALCYAIGPANFREVGSNEVTEKFNSWADGHQFNFLEELRIVGHNRHDVENVLKPLLTNDRISVVRKGRDGTMVRNVSCYGAATNHEDALPLSEEDRRWLVIATPFKDGQEATQHFEATQGANYWERLNQAIEEHAGAFRSYLLARDISGFNPNKAPTITEARQVMIDSGRPADEVAARNVIEQGGFGVTDWVFLSGFANDIISRNGDRKISAKRWASVAKVMGFKQAEKTVWWFGQKRRPWVNRETLDYYEKAGKYDELNAYILAALQDTEPPKWEDER